MPYIRHAMKVQVWDQWIGEDIGKTFCLMCQKTPITQMKFVCAHVLAYCMGGEISIENLRPLCTWCNSSMGRQHMRQFAEQNYPKSPIILTLTQPKIEGKPIDLPLNQELNTKIHRTTLARIDNDTIKKQKKLEQGIIYQRQKVQESIPEIVHLDQIGNKPQCPYCHKSLAHRGSIDRHIREGSCRALNGNISKKELIKSNNDKQLLIELMSKDISFEISQGISMGIKTALKEMAKIVNSSKEPLTLISSSDIHDTQYHSVSINDSVVVKDLADPLQKSYLNGLLYLHMEIYGDNQVPELKGYDIPLLNGSVHQLADVNIKVTK